MTRCPLRLGLCTLAQSLMDADLVDEYQLIVYRGAVLTTYRPRP